MKIVKRFYNWLIVTLGNLALAIILGLAIIYTFEFLFC